MRPRDNEMTHPCYLRVTPVSRVLDIFGAAGYIEIPYNSGDLPWSSSGCKSAESSGVQLTAHFSRRVERILMESGVDWIFGDVTKSTRVYKFTEMLEAIR